MARYKLHCSLITPEAKVFEGDVDSVVVPAHDGEIGILLDRAPLVCQLGAGRMKVRTRDAEHVWFVDGGFAQVIDNRVTVLTQKALPPGQIDRAEATRALEEARKMPATDETGYHRRTRAEASARARLRMSS
ncbi:MAG: ATP synthase F1 subunit epsilon [Planctomycetes bacterium]|nr:ATP synthase F1 subunit epsilon [Planctomycetota bacterium]